MGYHGDGSMLFERRANWDLTLHEIFLLLYANDMVLFSMKLENLVLMLKAMDSVESVLLCALMHPKQR
jgi:hypothetical protein